jgi:hypothetical protein
VSFGLKDDIKIEKTALTRRLFFGVVAQIRDEDDRV